MSKESLPHNKDCDLDLSLHSLVRNQSKESLPHNKDCDLLDRYSLSFTKASKESLPHNKDCDQKKAGPPSHNGYCQRRAYHITRIATHQQQNVCSTTNLSKESLPHNKDCDNLFVYCDEVVKGQRRAYHITRIATLIQIIGGRVRPLVKGELTT